MYMCTGIKKNVSSCLWVSRPDGCVDKDNIIMIKSFYVILVKENWLFSQQHAGPKKPTTIQSSSEGQSAVVILFKLDETSLHKQSHDLREQPPNGRQFIMTTQEGHPKLYQEFPVFSTTILCIFTWENTPQEVQ